MNEAKGKRSTQLLGELVSRLTRDYPDALWDGTTRELLDEANDHLGWEKLVWNLDNDESTDE